MRSQSPTAPVQAVRRGVLMLEHVNANQSPVRLSVAARWAHRSRVIEAMILLVLAGAAQRFIPMPRWSSLIGKPASVPADWQGQRIERLPLRWATLEERKVVKAIESASRWVPWTPRCLAEATAGQVMLRQFGAPGVVVIGLRPAEMAPTNPWNAHAWLLGEHGALDGRSGCARVHRDHGVPGARGPVGRPGAVDAASVRLSRSVVGEASARFDRVEDLVECPLAGRSTEQLNCGGIGESGQRSEESSLAEHHRCEAETADMLPEDRDPISATHVRQAHFDRVPRLREDDDAVDPMWFARWFLGPEGDLAVAAGEERERIEVDADGTGRVGE